MKTLLLILLSLFDSESQPREPTQGQIVAVEISLFEEAVALVKRYEGLHKPGDYPYVGYGHRMLPGESFDTYFSEQAADSLLRADLMAKCAVFRRFGKDSLLLGVLAYNVGEYRLLGYGQHPRSRLVEKLEAGDRDIRSEYISFRKWRGRVVPSIERRRVEEFELLFGKTKTIYKYDDNDTDWK